MCILIPIIHPTQQNILNGHPGPWRALHIALTGCHQLFQRILLIDGHDLIPQRIIGCMQGDRKTDMTLRFQLVDHWHHTRSAEGNSTTGEPISKVLHHQLHRRDHCIKVEQRLPHPHHHHIGNHTLMRAWPLSPQQAVSQPDLSNNLCRGEVAAVAMLRRIAEGTVESTPHL